jgi:hypothetical protein
MGAHRAHHIHQRRRSTLGRGLARAGYVAGGGQKYLYPPAGTYSCREVADTGQTSMHGWGAAIDINTHFSDYWLWRGGGGDPPPYVNRIPSDIVTVFERHGFIWGGRWAHYDTMHFEYRPELLGYRPPKN